MDQLRVTRTVAVPEQELKFRFSRSGGPGGQNVNTRDTKVEVIFDAARSPSLGPRQRERVARHLDGRLDSEGKLHVVASDERTQAQNRELAVSRLQAILAEALRPDPAPRRPTRPSKSKQRKRVESKRVRGRLKRLRGSAADDAN
ncbi:MAG: alternative ribosome rescue aminoacyl-tRNA hydrolase ArfB [Actinomycetota bacterium]